jgi:hypothetical protein
VPQAALSWQRVLVANWLSSSGKEWAHWVKQYNSGVCIQRGAQHGIAVQ